MADYQQTAQGFKAGSGIIGAFGALYAGKKEQQAYYRQSSLLLNNANEVMNRAREQVTLSGLEGKRLVGRQAVAASGSGLSVEQGTSAYDLMEDTYYNVTQDIYRQMREANYEAGTLRIQAQEARTAGDTARKASKYQAAGSLLSGAASAAMMGAS